MPKNLIKKYMPHPDKIREIKSLHFLGDVLHEPNLWHINRYSVRRAMLIGLFWAFIPMPFQMVASALCAIRFNANLPISVALVWITNPLTMPPIFYFNYVFGSWLLQMPPHDYHFELTWHWFTQNLADIGIPLYFGSVVLGLVFGATSYLVVDWLWRRKIRHDWLRRQSRKRQG
ncbi:DUF2062 domain-containing protein [Hahella sp. SMD15-11]|uniref:DUF2062 domain-containing protein n=1 Tax=Thermohahella caldifontis TaxID=3142973 RepID=A0AB39UZ18_9GAMM